MASSVNKVCAKSACWDASGLDEYQARDVAAEHQAPRPEWAAASVDTRLRNTVSSILPQSLEVAPNMQTFIIWEEAS